MCRHIILHNHMRKCWISGLACAWCACVVPLSYAHDPERGHTTALGVLLFSV